MRKLLLAVLLCVTAVAFAGNSPLRSADRAKAIAEIRKNQPQTSSLRLAGYGDLSKKINSLHNLAKHSADGQASLPVMEKPIRKTGLSDENYQRLDSAVAVNYAGLKVSKEGMVYTKVYLDSKYIQYLWDEVSNDWIVFMEEDYAWDEDEFLISLSAVYPEWGEGQKFEYTYDKERMLILSETMLYLIDGEWQYMEKLVREYDVNKNPVLQTAYIYDGIQWVNNVKRETVFDNQHRELDVQIYSWDGVEWNGDLRAQYNYDSFGNYTLYHYYLWDYEARLWYHEHKFEQEFNSFNKIMFQEESFWNVAQNAWVGWDDVPNKKTVWTYDAQNREIQQLYSEFLNFSEWSNKVAMETEYETPAGGGQKIYRKSFTYSDNSTRVHDQDLISEFDNLGRLYHKIELHLIGSNWITKYTEDYVYEGTNPEPVEVEWWIDDNGSLMPDLHQFFTYDEDYNRIQLIAYSRDFNSMEPAWIPFSKFNYEWDNGKEIRKYAWSHDGNDWVPAWGEGIDFDFNVPLSALIVPAFHYGYDYKVLHKYQFEGDYGTGGFNETRMTCYYSNHSLPTSVAKNPLPYVSVYPNPTTGVVNIDAPDNAIITVISLNGTRLLETYNKQIDLSRFAPGMYILDVNGIKTKLLKQ